MGADMDVTVSYCIVNTEQRALLLRCLDAVAQERAALPFATEVLVLDNASRDGSVGARARPAALPPPRDRDAVPAPRRGTGRGRRGVQPRPAALTRLTCRAHARV